jgi:tetratricopeptide (TPR) repeat protein
VPEAKRSTARELLAKAKAATHTSERERGYVDALSGYYEGDERGERERLASFLEGWTTVHESFPNDPEAELFTALATLANAPVADKSYTKQSAAGAMAEGVMARIPDHPGAHHYLIHAYDFPPLAEQALAAARRYGEVAPENSHALHMTSHIFTRLGLWPESITYNRRAAEAAGERDAGGNIHMHNLHALDYLAYAHLQTADDEAAETVLDTMRGYAPPYRDHPVTAYAFAAVPARMALERHDWDQAAELALRWPSEVAWDKFPQLEAIPYFGRALGAARTGDREAAESALARLVELEAAAGELDIAYDWETQVAVQRQAAEAWLVFESGDRETAVELMRQAAELEGTTEKNPVTPGEVLPARELFGDMLMATGDYAGAVEQYRKALDRSPNRFNSLYGAGRAAELDGDRATAESYYQQLLEVCADASGARSELDHAREFLS